MSQSTTAARKSGARASRALLDVAVEVVVVVGLGRRRLPPGQPVGGVVGERVEPDALLAAHLVEEQVGGDAVQPALERARRVGRQGPEDADEDVLGEVLGVVRVAGEAVGQPVDARGVRADDLVPAGRRPVGNRLDADARARRARDGRASMRPRQHLLVPDCSVSDPVVENSDSTHGARHPFQPNDEPGPDDDRRVPSATLGSPGRRFRGGAVTAGSRADRLAASSADLHREAVISGNLQASWAYAESFVAEDDVLDDRPGEGRRAGLRARAARSRRDAAAARRRLRRPRRGRGRHRRRCGFGLPAARDAPRRRAHHDRRGARAPSRRPRDDRRGGHRRPTGCG